MLSRLSVIPRFNSVLRQISTNSTLSKQLKIQTEPYEKKEQDLNPKINNPKLDNDLKKSDYSGAAIKPQQQQQQQRQQNQPKQQQQNQQQQQPKNEYQQKYKNYNNNFYNKSNFNRNNQSNFSQQKPLQQQQPQQKPQFQEQRIDENSQKKTTTFNKNNNVTQPVKNINFEKIAEERYKQLYKEIVEKLNNNINSIENLIFPCQQMNELYELDPKVTDSFLSDPIKNSVISVLLKNLNKMKTNDLFGSSIFILRFNPSKFDDVKELLNANLYNLEIGQILKLVNIMRTPQLFQMETMSTIRNITNLIRERIDEINDLPNIKLALKLFSQEPLVIKILDNKLLKLADSLSVSDWVSVLNAKSIYRQRNLAILETCAFNLIKNKTNIPMNVDEIQKSLLSCGILNYHDAQFYKFLLDSLNSELTKNQTKPNWVQSNEKNLLSIINSIGILQLREENVLNTLFTVLKNNLDKPKLIINFVLSCANINYDLKPGLKSLVSKIDIKDFNLEDEKEKVSFLNYVWSLCSLNEQNPKLVSKVLSEDFWKTLLNDKNSKEIKPILLKILNINLYSMLLLENYEGPNLPENFNIDQYTELLAPKQNNFSDMFVSALSSYRNIEKYAKLNLLTPFGMLIDALVIVDKNGQPCQLTKYFKNNSAVETTDNEIKVAFKLAGSRDQTMITKKFNGVLMFQIRLLEELGYKTSIITQEELKPTTLVNRVILIQNKLKELVQNKSSK